MVRTIRVYFLSFFTISFLISCAPDSGSEDGGIDTDVTNDRDTTQHLCDPNRIICEGNTAKWCNKEGSGWEKEEQCSGDTPKCYTGLGCVKCDPNEARCDGNKVIECSSDGMGWREKEECGEGESCVNGRCTSPCREAEANKSYEGCEYYAVTLMNSQLVTDFKPAIVISNRNQVPVRVTVHKGSSVYREITVNSQSTETVILEWVMELKQDFVFEEGSTYNTPERSVNISDSAYYIKSTLPVTIYQFNPLEYGLNRDCEDVEGDPEPEDGRCYSYSNDASLLLPIHVLTQHYIVMSRQSLGKVITVYDTFTGQQIERLYSFSPSTFAIVNPNDRPVDVTIAFSAPVQPGSGVQGYNRGDRATLTIQPRGVLQFAARSPQSCNPQYVENWRYPCDPYGFYECQDGYCDLKEYDFTGTIVEATLPVAVFGAHNCALVPYNVMACDHLEEQIFPFEAWGKHYIVGQSKRERNEPDVWRILSGEDNNQITFNPTSIHTPVTLNRGEFIEFEARGEFEINSTGPILVGQFIVGQNYSDPSTTELPPGDPSFSLAVPVEQYRTSYNFLIPATYDQSYINITVPASGTTNIFLDGGNLANNSWVDVPGTNYKLLRLPITPGSHIIASDNDTTFGIIVYGYGQYTSYMYPGGLDLEQISVW